MHGIRSDGVDLKDFCRFVKLIVGKAEFVFSLAGHEIIC